MHLTKALMAAGLALAVTAQAQPGAKNDPDLPAPYAVIEWPDLRNPRFVTLGGDHYLLAVRAGMQVWDAKNNVFSDAKGFPRHTSVEDEWAPLAGGTLISGRSHNDADVPYDSLIWWDAQAKTFSPPLVLAASTLVHKLVPVSAHYALACLRFGNVARPAGTIDDLAARAVLLDLADGKPRIVPVTAATRALLGEAGVRGMLDGEEITDASAPAATTAAVIFNVGNCHWEMRPVPESLAKVRDLTIKHHRLPDGRIVVTQADYFDPATTSRGTLTAPLLWDEKKSGWVEFEATAQSGGSPDSVSSYGIGDPVVAVTGVGADHVEFLDPASLRWTPSAQSLPETYVPDVAPLSNGDALVFTRENGVILRLNPMRRPAAGKFAYSHSYLGEIALSGGAVLLMGGGDQWHPQNRPEILRPRPSPAARLIAPLPELWDYVTGVELADHTILVYGGLPPRCAPSLQSSQCKDAPTQPAFRYFPEQDRWEPVAGIAMPFENGQFWSTGNSGETTQWPRNDAVVRRNGDFVYLRGQPSYRRKEGDGSPFVTDAMRWKPGQAPTKLATLRAGRSQGTLLELADGRLAVIGGLVPAGAVAGGADCSDCANEAMAPGELDWARSTEVFDARTKLWRAGPPARLAGGRALKLANGRIFKLSLTSPWLDEHGLSAEIADARFTRWDKLPAFPLKPYGIAHVAVLGNRVVMLPEAPHRHTVAWDDKRQVWTVWKNWTREGALSVTPVDERRALVRYPDSYEIISIPNN
jgi:hypothetical protein